MLKHLAHAEAPGGDNEPGSEAAQLSQRDHAQSLTAASHMSNGQQAAGLL